MIFDKKDRTTRLSVGQRIAAFWKHPNREHEMTVNRLVISALILAYLIASALQDVHRVEIARTAPRAPSPGNIGGGAQDPAPVFLGWLASRLGWTFTSRSAARDSRGRTIELSLLEDDRADIGPGQLTSVRIRCALDDQPLDCTIERTTAAAAALHGDGVDRRRSVWIRRCG